MEFLLSNNIYIKLRGNDFLCFAGYRMKLKFASFSRNRYNISPSLIHIRLIRHFSVYEYFSTFNIRNHTASEVKCQPNYTIQTRKVTVPAILSSWERKLTFFCNLFCFTGVCSIRHTSSIRKAAMKYDKNKKSTVFLSLIYHRFYSVQFQDLK